MKNEWNTTGRQVPARARHTPCKLSLQCEQLFLLLRRATDPVPAAGCRLRPHCRRPAVDIGRVWICGEVQRACQRSAGWQPRHQPCQAARHNGGIHERGAGPADSANGNRIGRGRLRSTADKRQSRPGEDIELRPGPAAGAAARAAMRTGRKCAESAA